MQLLLVFMKKIHSTVLLDLQIDKLKALYSEYSALPIPSKAYLLSEPSSKADSPFVPQLIKVNWQYRDTIQVKTVTFQKNYLCSRDLNIVPLGMPEELSSEYASLVWCCCGIFC